MVLMCLILALDWKVTETGVYQPLDPREVVVADEGQVYVLNFDDAVILHYDVRGELTGKIGRKGKGPGEFTYCMGLYYDGGKLFVQDLLTQSISVFAADGGFEKRFKMPERNLLLRKVKGGWMYGTWMGFSLEPEASLFITDEEMKETIEVLKVPDRGHGSGSWVMRNNGKTLARYSPLTNRPRLEISPDGSIGYLTDLYGLKIQVIDIPNRKVTTEIARSVKPIPFDEEWADAKMKNETSGAEPGLKFEKQYPEYFPAIRDFRVMSDGTLVINRWRGKPGSEDWLLAMDPDGNEVAIPFSWDVIERLAGSRDGYAYITMFSEGDEEGWLTRVAKKEVDQFVKDNPLDPNAERSRSISISN